MQTYTKTYKPGAHLFRENDHSRELYIVQSGNVRVYRRIGNRDIELAHLSKGSVLGEMAIIDGKPRSASALALEETTAILIDADTFAQRISGVPPWYLSMIRTTSEKIRKANARLEAIQTDGHCLHGALALFYIYQHVTGSGKEDALDMKQVSRMLMQLLNVRSQCVTNLFGSLQANDLIDINENKIRINDMEKYNDYCAFLRLIFHKSFEVMTLPDDLGAAVILALREAVAAGTVVDKTIELLPEAMSTALTGCNNGTFPMNALSDLKALGVLSYVKSSGAVSDAPPPAGYQFFIDAAIYRKYLLYYTYKHMVPNL